MPPPATHITLLTTTLDVSGAEQVIALLADGLADAGYRVSVLGLQRRSGALAGIIRNPQVFVGDLGMSSAMDVGVARRLRQWLIGERVTILYSFLFHAHLVGRWAAHRTRMPLVISSQQVAEWGGWVRRTLERWTAPWCDVFVAVSPSVRDDLVTRLRVPAERVWVIPNAIRVADFTPARTPFATDGPDAAIGSACRLAREKDHESLLRGFALLKDRYPAARLRLAGSGPLAPQIHTLIAQLGLDRHVEMLGRIDDVRSFYQGLDIYVQPSRTEGLPCAVLEAMTMARPVVATDVPGNRDAVVDQETGLLITPASPVAWAEALSALLDDRERARHLGRMGRKRALAAFDVARMIDETLRLLDAKYPRAPLPPPRSIR